MFKSIGLVIKSNLSSKNSKVIEELVGLIATKTHKVFVDDFSIASSIKGVEFLSGTNFGKSTDLIIVLGGDGTFLRAAKKYYKNGKPFIGVNLGRVGFLTDLSLKNLKTDITDVLINNKYSEEKRDLILASFGNSNEVALNEVVIHSGSYAQLMRYKLNIDNTFIYEQRSDGLIVATSTGSTAYALSAGGPIIHPDLKIFNIIPMFSQSLSSRPLICSNASVIRVEIVSGPRAQGFVSLDGQEDLPLPFGKTIEIKRLTKSLRIIRPLNNDFFSACREKLGWSIEVNHKR
ncbi:MAG: NAD(+)/NADH kinase [Gammaproteobacteria bacterium]